MSACYFSTDNRATMKFWEATFTMFKIGNQKGNSEGENPFLNRNVSVEMYGLRFRNDSMLIPLDSNSLIQLKDYNICKCGNIN